MRFECGDGPVLAIHGGCGAIPRAKLTDELGAAARSGLRTALQAGWEVLDRGGAALDAVTEAVCALEDHPSFNAGHGATFNAVGFHELDASVMDGATGVAGGVGAVERIRHPVLAARELARRVDPVLLFGPATDEWAGSIGLELVENSAFSTESRRAALTSTLARQEAGTVDEASEHEKHGTVGAVARDARGHLAAATSTGGYTAKPVGRVGDSPIVGAGTWASDATCAVSGTGKGELFIRTAFAHTIHTRMLYLGEPLEVAAQVAVDAVGELGGGAGLCAVDSHGTVVFPYNTEGMYRGYITADGEFAAIHET